MNLFKQAVRMAYTRTQTKDPRSEVFIIDVAACHPWERYRRIEDFFDYCAL